MTSMEFFRPSGHDLSEPPEWGTGKDPHAKKNIWIPGPPTWQCSGRPIQQDYTLTKLKLSNVRTNDQLLPEPQRCEMQPLMIQKSFPAEHPYSSHIPRFAVIPTFESPADPIKGADARAQMPKNGEMPSQSYDVIILNKSKGTPLRRELQSLPSESRKLALEWKSHDFDQIPKSPTNMKQDFYPIPPKVFVPSHKKRSDSSCIRGNMEVSARTADTTKNVEREQWQTTYDRNHTGLGPTDPMNLDNWGEKLMDPNRGNTLKSRSVRTFDPPRPREGRIARALTPPPPPQTPRFPDPPKDETYRRKLTLTEREDKRLWEGADYLNLPGEAARLSDIQWREQQEQSHPAPHLTSLATSRTFNTPQDAPFQAAGAPSPPATDYVEDLALKQHQDHQQIEASNRWSLLESVTPAHDVTSLHQKMELASSKTQPHVFHEHEGQYQRERAGMYQTSYDPAKLEHCMNHEDEAASRRMDISTIHRDALNLPVDLNEDMASAMRYSRTLGGPPGSVPQLHNQPSQYEAITPFDKAKQAQRGAILPNSRTADIRTQEGGVVLTESTYGTGYNTEKFLQQEKLPFHARQEPLHLMSHENQNLNKVRITTTPTADVPGIRKPEAPYERELPNVQRPATAPDDYLASSGVRYSYQIQERPSTTNRTRDHQFLSKSTNFMPANGEFSSSAYKKQFPNYSVDMSFKQDERFQWKAGSGTPRPQTSLLQIQDSFSETDVKKKFRQQFPENLPDLRENIAAGKKHQFGSLNAQILRGTPIVEVA